jgi:Ca2+-binding EF-hand superfamily protein
MQKQHQYTLKTAQRQAFLEVFNLHAKGGRVGKEELKAMFSRVGYFISEEHFADICSKAFELNDTVTFEEFMEVFRVRDSPHSLLDIKNAFRLLAGEEDEFLPLETMYEIFRKAGVERERVDDLLAVLSDFVDVKRKLFNYRQFLQHLS